MKIYEALKESAQNKDTKRFHKLLNKLNSKGLDINLLPVLDLASKEVGAEAHKWASDSIEEFQVS